MVITYGTLGTTSHRAEFEVQAAVPNSEPPEFLRQPAGVLKVVPNRQPAAAAENFNTASAFFFRFGVSPVRN